MSDKIRTNADAIHSMTDRELMNFFALNIYEEACHSVGRCCKNEDCCQCYMKWLQSPCNIPSILLSKNKK